MERFILNKLLEWKNSPYRKPLILKGVRQVGKTWILKEFGSRYYENTAVSHCLRRFFAWHCPGKAFFFHVTGGMPESVKMWTQARDVSAMQEALSGILGAYERDFAKHPNVNEFPKISMVWKSILSQLAKENKKFIYKVIKEGARAREYEDALQWLVDARLVHKVYRSTAPGLPVSAYDVLSAFKIYLADVGLLRRLAQLAPTAFGEGNRLFTEFKGALTENYVLQTLITQFEVVPRYWTQTNPPYEVDFLIQRENDIFPVEVKSEANTASRSLKKFKELFSDKVKFRVRFSLDNLKLNGDVFNVCELSYKI